MILAQACVCDVMLLLFNLITTVNKTTCMYV